MTDALNDKQSEGILGTIPMARLGQGEKLPPRSFISPAEAGLRDRPDPSCEWRNGYVLEKLSWARESLFEAEATPRQSRQACVNHGPFGSEGLTGAEKYGFARHKAVVPAFIG